MGAVDAAIKLIQTKNPQVKEALSNMKARAYALIDLVVTLQPMIQKFNELRAKAKAVKEKCAEIKDKCAEKIETLKVTTKKAGQKVAETLNDAAASAYSTSCSVAASAYSTGCSAVASACSTVCGWGSGLCAWVSDTVSDCTKSSKISDAIAAAKAMGTAVC